MPPKFIFITLISISCIGLVVSFFRAFSSKHNLLELIPLIGATSWAIGFTWIYTQNPQPLGMGLLFNATILGSLHLFCAILSKKHINVPRWHLLGGVVTTLGLFLTPLTSITAVEKIAIYSFFGILNTLLLLLFCERLHHIFKANNHNNNQLLISLSIISGTFFLLFCDMTVSPYLGTSRPQLIAGAYFHLPNTSYWGKQNKFCTKAFIHIPTSCISNNPFFHFRFVFNGVIRNKPYSKKLRS